MFQFDYMTYRTTSHRRENYGILQLLESGYDHYYIHGHFDKEINMYTIHELAAIIMTMTILRLGICEVRHPDRCSP